MLREMVREFAQRMITSTSRSVNPGRGVTTKRGIRNGNRRREWDTRAGTEALPLGGIPDDARGRC